MKKVERASIGWSFWLQWIPASALGGCVGLPVSFVVAWVVTFAKFGMFGYAESSLVDRAVIWAVVGAAAGASVGITQLLVLLRWHVSQAYLWVLASVVGWTMSFAASFAVLPAYEGSLACVVGGVIGCAIVGLTGAALVRLLRQPVSEA